MAAKILLADDHAIIRQGLRSLLEKQPDIEVVGEVADGRKAIELARELKPDIVIMDITMPISTASMPPERLSVNPAARRSLPCQCIPASDL